MVAPSNPADAKGLLRAAIADDNPVIYLENKRITAKRGQPPPKTMSSRSARPPSVEKGPT